MSCRLQSRLTTILLLAILPLCLTTHGSGFDRNQSVQVGKNLQTLNSKHKGEDKVNLEITGQQSNAASTETLSRWSSQTRHSVVDETSNSKRYKSSSAFHQSNDPSMFTPRQGFDGEAGQGKVTIPNPHVIEEWLQMRPLIQCSPAAIILTAKGWSYVHLLVDRVNASPVSVLHLPSHCGYNVKATWRDLVLIAPYDGCYVLKQNGSYVLPLLWWGMPVSVSCPMTPVSAPAMPSGLCSYLGITLKIDGSLRGIEKYSIKVNEEWVPLVSNTCAHRMVSAPEDLILFIPFTAQCAKDRGSIFNVLVDGKMYVLSCQPLHYNPYYPLYHPSAPISQPLHPMHAQIIPLDPTLIKPEMAKPHLVPEMPAVYVTGVTVQHPQHPFLPSYDISQVPVLHSSEIPTTNSTKITIPPFGHLQLIMPMVYPSYQHLPTPMASDSPVIEYKSALKQTPKPQTIAVQESQMGPVPQMPQARQVPQIPQHNRFPVLANDSSQLSPVLTCKGDRLRAFLPSVKITSIKVKDVKRKVWVPVSSAPAHCGYSLQRKGRGVVFSSPLPVCHSYTMSPSLLSLSLKFWNFSISRHQSVRLQCPYTSPSPARTESPATTARHIWPSPLSNLSKPRDSPIHSQIPIVPSLYSPKTTAPSFQQAKYTKPTSWPPKFTRLSQTPPLASQMNQPQVLCHSKDMSVTLPPGPITSLMVQSPTVGVKGSINAVLLDEAPSHCGYLIKKNQNGGINVLLPYSSCHMAHQDGQYRIVLKYQTSDGRRVEAFLSCQVPVNHECSLPFEQQLACGPSSVSATDCQELGCCYSPHTRTCYYPMDECTADRHFVFSIPASLTEPPLSPTRLVAAGNNSCTPQRVVADLALFKIPLDGCGAHKYEVGNTVIYMLEILNTLNSMTLNYGSITRDSPFRLLVECRYLPGTVASVGYLVKSPSLGPSIQAKGVFGVQLRIAKDQQYSSYYPQYHRPLRKLLGKPLYLEVRLLNSLDPSAVLLVHYCVAYPRSAHSAWVLIYDGCPNPLDVTPSHEPPPTPPEALAKHVRRFTVSTFQFLENTKKETAPEEEVDEEEGEEEEIYFMCATEVCLPSEGPCVEGCIDRVVAAPAVKS
ncbi:uncharacterized protein LOC108258484 isoform X2 [Ictalurus punctatus]|uniref:Uncharacterized protein LOC108258484 isoform X2 n=1 Tax=Ictalurus punctatus TaxID=7998 RepID=A0A2D0Q5K2_ICTPU|nr:uncharacterized protein LOC108258484 isoform X2 [Ictalurus punctatus]